MLITDHNVRETLGICDHAYIISDGSVLAAGRQSEIIENESVRRVYLGETFPHVERAGTGGAARVVGPALFSGSFSSWAARVGRRRKRTHW